MSHIFFSILFLTLSIAVSDVSLSAKALHSRAARYSQYDLKSLQVERKRSNRSKGISFGQLLTFTSGLLPFDIAEKSFTLADRNGDGLLNEYETQQASKIGNELTRNRLQEVITEADKSADGLIELNRAKMLAQRLGSLSVQNDSMATADRNDLKSNDIERVLNTNSNRRSLDSIFGHFDEESDGSWNRDEIERFLHVMCIDKKQWLRALKDAHFDNNTLCELTIDDLQRILQEYDPERQFFT